MSYADDLTRRGFLQGVVTAAAAAIAAKLAAGQPPSQPSIESSMSSTDPAKPASARQNSPLGRVTTYSYDSGDLNGRVITYSYDQTCRISHLYDKHGRVVAICEDGQYRFCGLDAARTTYIYDALGHRTV